MATPEPHDPQAGSPWRSWLVLPFCLCWATLNGLIIIVTAQADNLRHSRWWIRLWGRVQLAAMGIRLEVHGAERVNTEGPALILFNHQSLIDMHILAATVPSNGVVIYKEEFHSIPVLGQILRHTGNIPINRRHHEKSKKSMDLATEIILDKQRKVLISPEGTRSRHGGLLRFKLGAFHLAASTGVPLIPMIIRGPGELMPVGRQAPRTGTVRVDYLEPISTKDWTADHVRDSAATLRDLFLEWLPPAADTPTSGNS